MYINRKFMSGYLKDVIKPGAVIVSHGVRGGGKTHCAISFCQRLIEGWFEGMPKHVVLVTNVIFVRKKEDGSFETRSPPGVHTIHCMQDLFPIVVKTVEEHGTKDTMIILLLDEAQHFLLGDDNNKTDMASSMKKFSGIIRKFSMALWLITPTMRNLGPAFRNFIDADNDPANVTCVLEKDNRESRRQLLKRGLVDEDPRSIVWCQPGAHELRIMLPVPTSSWTRNPDEIAPGDYVYDNMSSADFEIGDFPFRDFVRCISGRSSYEMIPTIKEFYRALESGELPGQDGPAPVDVDKAVHQKELEILKRCLDAKLTSAMIAQILGVHTNTVAKWKKKLEENQKEGGSRREWKGAYHDQNKGPSANDQEVRQDQPPYERSPKVTS